MEPSIQNLIQQLSAVVFKKVELMFRDLSELKAYLPIRTYQVSNSDIQIID